MTNTNAVTVREVERKIWERTGGRVRDLHVRLLDGQVVVCGRVPTYYLKQLALHAAREAVGVSPPLRIDIAVT